MLTNWISPEALKSLNDGVVLRSRSRPRRGRRTQAFPFYRSSRNPLLFFVFELYLNEAAWGAHETADQERGRATSAKGYEARASCPSFRSSPTKLKTTP
jgi:hypothetical protein